jgi:hypothetical protein
MKKFNVPQKLIGLSRTMLTNVSCRVKMQNNISGMMEAVRTSETSVDNYFTRQYIPEDNSELQDEQCLHINKVFSGYKPCHFVINHQRFRSHLGPHRQGNDVMCCDHCSDDGDRDGP